MPTQGQNDTQGLGYNTVKTGWLIPSWYLKATTPTCYYLHYYVVGEINNVSVLSHNYRYQQNQN